MRRHGALGTASDLGIHDHGCWLYRGDAVLRHAVVEYLSDGRRLGQRLVYVGGKPEIGLRADLDGLEDVEPLLRDGGLRVVPIPELYRPGEPIDAEGQLATFAEATEEALADGYTGLRVAAEVTTLVTEPETWSAHTRCGASSPRRRGTDPRLCWTSAGSSSSTTMACSPWPTTRAASTAAPRGWRFEARLSG
jgi:MEDS: MEthanogen/methylotroph, DcmR Sensory domain